MKKKVLVGVIALLLIGAIIGGLFWYKKKKAADAGTPGTVPATSPGTSTGTTGLETAPAASAGIVIVAGSNMDSNPLRTLRPDLWAQRPADWSDVGYLTNHRDVYDWLKAGANSTPLEHYIVSGRAAGYTYK